MKLIISGSRDIQGVAGRTAVYTAIRESGWFDSIHEVVSGGADGIDKIGEEWALIHGIPTTRFLPDWERYGKSAGPIRNRKMGEYADKLIAIWNGKSRGTKNMLKEMKRLNKPVYVYLVTIDIPNTNRNGKRGIAIRSRLFY